MGERRPERQARLAARRRLHGGTGIVYPTRVVSTSGSVSNAQALTDPGSGARFASGDTSGAYDLLDREWGQMPDGDPGNTLWEVMAPDGTVHTPGINGSGDGGTSMAHGWATGPTSALSQYVLGIAPVSPGYANWSVDPHPGSLAWAQGRVPTPHGSLDVAWTRAAAGHQFILDVTPPASTTGTITVPLTGSQAVVRVNGELVWANGQFRPAPGVTAATADGGSLHIAVTSTQSFHVVSQEAGS